MNNDIKTAVNQVENIIPPEWMPHVAKEPGRFSRFKRKTILFIILAVIVITGIILAAYLLFSRGILPNPTGLQPQTVSKPVPATIVPVRGKITKVGSANLDVAAYGKSFTFSLNGVHDIQRIISGSIAGGDAKTGPSSVSALEVGQEVFVIADKDSMQPKTIFILK